MSIQKVSNSLENEMASGSMAGKEHSVDSPEWWPEETFGLEIPALSRILEHSRESLKTLKKLELTLLGSDYNGMYGTVLCGEDTRTGPSSIASDLELLKYIRSITEE